MLFELCKGEKKNLSDVELSYYVASPMLEANFVPQRALPPCKLMGYRQNWSVRDSKPRVSIQT